jgi:hypothetical protein
MLTDSPINDPVAVFFFAHQDDEFGVFQKIIDESRKGNRVLCAYLTDGVVAKNGVSAECRNQETIGVLSNLNILRQDIYFAGESLSISDGYLPDHLDIAAEWIQNWLARFSVIKTIYVPAWEGGHHDHDALHALIVSIGFEKNKMERIKQFPLYNSYRCAGPFFKVLSPLPLNGQVENSRISWINRLLFLRYCLNYKSQAKSWIGLFPFVLLHYLVSGRQTVQSVSCQRILEKPHDGLLYYEKRNFFTWEKMIQNISTWRHKNKLSKTVS